MKKENNFLNNLIYPLIVGLIIAWATFKFFSGDKIPNGDYNTNSTNSGHSGNNTPDSIINKTNETTVVTENHYVITNLPPENKKPPSQDKEVLRLQSATELQNDSKPFQPAATSESSKEEFEIPFTIVVNRGTRVKKIDGKEVDIKGITNYKLTEGLHSFYLVVDNSACIVKKQISKSIDKITLSCK